MGYAAGHDTRVKDFVEAEPVGEKIKTLSGINQSPCGVDNSASHHHNNAAQRNGFNEHGEGYQGNPAQ